MTEKNLEQKASDEIIKIIDISNFDDDFQDYSISEDPIFSDPDYMTKKNNEAGIIIHTSPLK